ncbi:MAG: 4Fe-4S dicluster domain-containing protein [Pseudomonadota bacterium]
MNETESKLKDAVKELLATGRVDLVIGYEKGSLPLRSRPCFVRRAEEVDRLVWNSYCTNNLAVYLPRLFEKPARPKPEYAPPKVGIVGKGCDTRSVIGLIKEHQLPRENIVLIGMPCAGMIDVRKVEAALGGAPVADGKKGADGTFEVTTVAGQTKQLKKEDVIADACRECSYPSVDGVDIQIEGDAIAATQARYTEVAEFEAKSPEERWQYFIGEMSKCIRCHACRQACPNCYCKVCFVDQTKPRWVGAGDDLSDAVVYHLGRIFHQAGRCVECDACVRACPMGIDLRLFTAKLRKDVNELFAYVPGLSLDELPPLCTFAADDSQGFITEPEEE